MPTAFDTRVLQKVVDALDRVGTTATITRYSGSYSTASTKNTRTPTPHTVKASPPSPYTKRFAAQDLVREELATSIVPAQGLAIVPKPGDQFTYATLVWEVIQVEEIRGQAEAVAYEVFVTR